MEGRYIANGYVRIRVFDENGRARWVLEHRHVMSQILGRPLYPDEQVHHKHEPKTDNSPGNLELWCLHQPMGHRVEDLVAWAHEILARYGSVS